LVSVEVGGDATNVVRVSTQARGGDVQKVRAFEKIEHKYGLLFSWRDGKQECPTSEMFELIRVRGESRKDIRAWR